MSRTLTTNFAKAAKPKPKRRRPCSLSIRVSDEERAILERKAGKRSLGAYVREMALGDAQAPRRKGAVRPPVDYAMLGQALGKTAQRQQLTAAQLSQRRELVKEHSEKRETTAATCRELTQDVEVFQKMETDAEAERTARREAFKERRRTEERPRRGRQRDGPTLER